jgi:hypothetical protein
MSPTQNQGLIIKKGVHREKKEKKWSGVRFG